MKRESRTSSVLRKSFNSNTGKLGGHTARSIKITPKTDFRERISEESKIRNELQNNISMLIKQRKSVEEIKQILSEDKYKKYEQYLDLWIQDNIFRENPLIKSVLIKAVNDNKGEKEIMQEIEKENSELYYTYKEQIMSKVKSQIQLRQSKQKQKGEKRKEQEEER